MIRVYVNERRSVKIPEKVTAQAECWAPKALLAHRAHDWSYDGDKAYLWVMLPPGTRMVDRLQRGTWDYIELLSDPYRAPDDAVYAQRNVNRMISENATLHADAADDTNDCPEISWLLLSFRTSGHWVLYLYSTTFLA